MSARWHRYLLFSGILAVALLIAGSFVLDVGAPNEENVTADMALAYYVDNESTILAGGLLVALGAFVFIWFTGSLWRHLGASEGTRGLYSMVTLVCGVLLSGFYLAMAGASLAPVIDTATLTAPLAHTFFRIWDLFFFSAEITAAAFVIAVGAVAVSVRALPVWFGWVSFVLGLWLLAAPIGFLGLMFGLPLWTLAASVLAFIYSGRESGQRMAVVPEEETREEYRQQAA
jgi:hypothetical protein